MITPHMWPLITDHHAPDLETTIQRPYYYAHRIYISNLVRAAKIFLQVLLLNTQTQQQKTINLRKFQRCH